VESPAAPDNNIDFLRNSLRVSMLTVTVKCREFNKAFKQIKAQG